MLERDPFRTEEEMLNLGLGSRVAAAVVMEERDPVTNIELRCAGFRSRESAVHRGIGRMLFENSFDKRSSGASPDAEGAGRAELH